MWDLLAGTWVASCFMLLKYLFMFNPHYCDGAEGYSGCLTSMKQRGRQCGAGQREMFLTFYSHDWHQHVGQTWAEEQQHSSFFHLYPAARCPCERQRNCVARGTNVFLFNPNLFFWLSLLFPCTLLWKKVIYPLESFLSFGIFASHAYLPFVWTKKCSLNKQKCSFLTMPFIKGRVKPQTHLSMCQQRQKKLPCKLKLFQLCTKVAPDWSLDFVRVPPKPFGTIREWTWSLSGHCPAGK